MKKRFLPLIVALSLLLAAGTASARGGHGGGRSAAGGAHGWPHYGYYGGYSHPVWIPGYWTERCTPEYCEKIWIPGYWRLW